MISPVLHCLAAIALLAPPGSDPEFIPDCMTPPFLQALGMERPKPPSDPWGVTNPSSQTTWDSHLAWFNSNAGSARILVPFSFQDILDRVSPLGESSQNDSRLPGVKVEKGRWMYQGEVNGRGIYKLNSRVELPDPGQTWIPAVGHNWQASERVSIPMPALIPMADQFFLYGQFDGSGDALSMDRTSLIGRTGIAVKWALPSKTELQLRYSTLFSYSDPENIGRFQERAQPALEVLAKMPLLGPMEIEYNGIAVPGVTRAEADQLRQELRLAVPLRGDNAFEFGARYRWEATPDPTPWVDRAQLFMGLRLRH